MPFHGDFVERTSRFEKKRCLEVRSRQLDSGMDCAFCMQRKKGWEPVGKIMAFPFKWWAMGSALQSDGCFANWSYEMKKRAALNNRSMAGRAPPRSVR